MAEAKASAIEKAYMQGYNEAVEENSKDYIKIVEDGVEYIDLGLPSGTLWTLKSYKWVSYVKSQKLNIPTRKQIDELVKFTRWRVYKCGNWDCDWRFEFIDTNARRYTFPTGGDSDGSGMTKGDFYLWFRSELDKDGNAPVVHLYGSHSSCINKIFPGYGAFALFVK